jgi:hypothetical protein
MKATPKSTLAALSAAILVALAISSCATKKGGASGGTHNMGGPKPSYPMFDENMQGR